MSKVLIYKESALDILDDFQSDIENCVPNAYATARQRMSGLYPRNPDWIPCSERLPEDPNPRFIYASKTYQVTTASGEVVALKWQKTEVRGKTVMRWEWSSGAIYHGDALAWKPLSEPWKGADDER